MCWASVWGILCSLIIFLKVRYELSHDVHHNDLDRLYRVTLTDTPYGEIEMKPGVPFPLAPALRQEIPDFESVVLVDKDYRDAIISIQKEDGTMDKFVEKNGVAYADSNYFDVFHYNWVEGSPDFALKETLFCRFVYSFSRKIFRPDLSHWKNDSVQP